MAKKQTVHCRYPQIPATLCGLYDHDKVKAVGDLWSKEVTCKKCAKRMVSNRNE